MLSFYTNTRFQLPPIPSTRLMDPAAAPKLALAPSGILEGYGTPTPAISQLSHFCPIPKNNRPQSSPVITRQNDRPVLPPKSMIRSGHERSKPRTPIAAD